MLARHAVLSRTTIFILAFILVQTGLARHANPPLAITCVLAGTAGLLGYVGVKCAAFVRCRQEAVALLIEWGHVPRAEA